MKHIKRNSSQSNNSWMIRWSNICHRYPFFYQISNHSFEVNNHNFIYISETRNTWQSTLKSKIESFLQFYLEQTKVCPFLRNLLILSSSSSNSIVKRNFLYFSLSGKVACQKEQNQKTDHTLPSILCPVIPCDAFHALPHPIASFEIRETNKPSQWLN